MASSANNANATTNTNKIGGGGVGGGGGAPAVNSIRGVCNVLQQQQQQQLVDFNGGGGNGGSDAWSYDRIIAMMQKLDLQDDGILMNNKIQNIEDSFCNIVRDETMLCEFMQYINDKALEETETALKFALLFSSRSFDALAMNETKVRCIMLKILETNYMNADLYRQQDPDRLYNSIMLLGEYYHRVRLADNSPIAILGESLLTLLTHEISGDEVIDAKRAKLILSQITLNGDIMRGRHKTELTNLFYHIRRHLIEQPALPAMVKALLLMTLDLYYSNFANLGVKLEEMYTKYLVEEDDQGNNNNNCQPAAQTPMVNCQPAPAKMSNGPTQLSSPSQGYHQQSPPSPYRAQQTPQQQQQQQQQQQAYQGSLSPTSYSTTTDTTTDSGNNNSMTTTTNTTNNTSNSYEPTATTASTSDDLTKSDSDPPPKKWSEQVCEESFLEGDEFYGDYNGDSVGGEQQHLNVSGSSARSGDQLNSSFEGERHGEKDSRNSRRSHKPRSSPRPLKSQTIANSSVGSEGTQKSEEEERDQTKPLPRWRAPRYNNSRHGDNDDSSSRHRNSAPRRFSASLDDDEQSVRSEGGSIRLYSINDRLKHSQEKIERSIGNHFSAIANSNWDRQSQHDDRSERSYISNYERGNNYRRGGGRAYHNRHTYDKPPRFQKNQQQQQQHNNNPKDNNKIHSDSWRRSYGGGGGGPNGDSGQSYANDDAASYRSNGSMRASTLPRPRKNNMDGGFNRRSQSPFQRQQQQQQQQQRSPRHHNGRYSSHSSLASETSSTFERRSDQRGRNFGRNQRQQDEHWEKGSAKGDNHQHQRNNNKDWEGGGGEGGEPNSELVRNARQTTKYMNYLSSKK